MYTRSISFRFETDYSDMPANVYDSSLVKTRIYKVLGDKLIPAGYCGTEYIRNGGWSKGYETLIATVPGTICYSEQDEWIELLSE